MKSNFLSVSMLSLLMLLSGAALTSCGDEADEPGNGSEQTPSTGDSDQSSAYQRIGMTYEIELSDAWWDFFDIEVTYTAADGELKTETIEKGWSYSGSIAYAEVPDKMVFRSKAIPKAQHPAIDENTTYALDRRSAFHIYGLDADNKVVATLSTRSSSVSLSCAGSKFGEYITSEHDSLAGWEYEFEK